MTRQERQIESRNKVINAITGAYANEYKKKSGAWNIAKIAKNTVLNRDTVAKHLQDYEARKAKIKDEQ